MVQNSIFLYFPNFFRYFQKLLNIFRAIVAVRFSTFGFPPWFNGDEATQAQIAVQQSPEKMEVQLPEIQSTAENGIPMDTPGLSWCLSWCLSWFIIRFPMTVAYFMRFGGFWRYPMVLDAQNNAFMLGLVIQAAFGFPMFPLFPILHGLDT